jgi:hypothetical protein
MTLAAGILASSDAEAARYITWGYTFVALGSDIGFLAKAADAQLKALRQTISINSIAARPELSSATYAREISSRAASVSARLDRCDCVSRMSMIPASIFFSGRMDPARQAGNKEQLASCTRVYPGAFWLSVYATCRFRLQHSKR